MTRRVWVHDPALLPPERWPEPCPCPDRLAVRVLVDGYLAYAGELPRAGRGRSWLTRFLVARSARMVSRAMFDALADERTEEVVHYIACPACDWLVLCYRAQRLEIPD